MAGGTDTTKLVAELRADMTDAAREALGEHLRQSCHDLNNPLGTLGLELFSLDEVLVGALESLGPAAHGPAAADLAELRTILTNLTQAQRQLEVTVSALQRFARALS